MNLLFLVGATMVKILPYMILLFLPFRKHYRFSLPKTIAANLAFVVVAIIGAYLILPESNTFTEWLLYYAIITSILGLVYCLALIKGNFFQIIFNFFVILCYTTDINFYSIYLESYILQTNSIAADHGGFIFCNLLILAFTFPFMWLFMTKLLLPVIQNKEHGAFWSFLWIIPFSFYTLYRLGMDPSNFAGYLSIGTRNELLIQISWTIATFLSFGMLLQMLKETGKNELLQRRLQATSIRLDLQRKEYDRLGTMIEETRQTRHDFRQHLVMLRSYAQENDLTSIDNYIGKYLKALDLATSTTVCENHAFNAVIQYYAGLAHKKNINMELSFNLPPDLPLPETDMTVILGNIFENALEACERQASSERFIQAKGAIIGDNMLAVTVKNSFEHEIRKNGTAFLSSKREAEGIGTESIRSIAERYNGVAKFSYGNGVFETSVLLNAQPSI